MVLLAKLSKDFTLIEEKEGNSLYSQGWYGQYTNKNYLKLDPYETVILLERGRIEVIENENNVLPLSEVVAYFSNNIPNFLVHYLLYKDLRGRGYVIKRHSTSEKYFELYERGATPKNAKHLALVVPMVEGVLFDIEGVDKIVSESQSISKKLVFAVIDSLGDVSYYSVSELDFPDLTEQKGDL